MTQVVTKSTKQTAFIASTSTEFGTKVYKLVDENGSKVWNGDMSHFDETQLTFATYRIYTPQFTVKFAGTDSASFFNDLKTAVEKTDFDKGETIYEYCMKTQRPLWEIMVDKRYLETV